MLITQVDLDNVKSYRRANIAFTRGTNAICGPNGAGKSTLLESIGFALFDVLPYPQSQFVREGEKTATVTVHLVAGDGRAYQVVRRCGSRSQYYVYDPEIEQKLTTTKGETVEWLYEFMGVEESSDLAVLFKDAVGVPQGLLTAAFLLSPAHRKSTFDPLLRVDEYKRVWNALLEPRRHLENQITDEEKRIAAFEAEVKALPGWQARAADLGSAVQAGEERQKAKGIELADVTRRKAELEAVKDRLDALEKSAAQAEGQVKTLAAQLAAAGAAVEGAEAAQAVVDSTEAGHQAYLAARTSLEKLEAERKERDTLRAAVQEQATGLALDQQKVDRLENQLEGITAAEAEVEALRPQVETQERLELQLNQAQRAADRLAGEQRGLAQEKERLASLQARLAQVRTDLEELTRVEGELESMRGELAALDERWEELRVQIAGHELELSQIDEQARRADSRIAAAESLSQQDRSKLARLEDRRSELQEALTELATVEAESAALRSGLEDLNTQHQELASQAAARGAKMDQVGTQTDALEAAETALCPVCEGPLTPEYRAELLARNRDDLERLAAELGEVQNRLAEVASDKAKKQDALAALEQRARELPRPGEVDELTAQLETQQEAVGRSEAALADERAEAEALEQRRKELETALAELRPQADRAQDTRDGVRQGIESRETRRQELPRPAEKEELSTRIDDLGARVKNLESAVAELASAPADVQRLTAELASLGDPRRDLQRATDIAGQRAGVEADLAATEEQILKLQARIDEISGDLAAYTGLDERLDAQRQILETRAKDHQRYLGHIREAEALPARLGQVETLEAELKAAQAERERLIQEQDETAAGYDAAAYTALVATFQTLAEELATLEERLRQQRAQLGEAQAEIDRLAAVQDQLGASRDELGALTATQAILGYLRGVLRDAGPKVTQALVVAISQQAARLYADIMADHTARLQWTEDYEILLTTGGRERTFQQLSGGEQMASALAVRLALLREVSDIDVAFFDEPTANLDDQRRDNLAEQILNVKGLSQLFVISHDDTFERDTDHVIRVVKEHGVSRLGTESLEGVEA